MRRAGILYKRKSSQAREAALRVVEMLEGAGLEVVVEEVQHRSLGKGKAVVATQLGELVEFVVCLGGDGTLLHCAGMLRDHNVPILGVNMGNLGFLTPFYADELDAAVEAALAGSLATQDRIRLEVRLKRATAEGVTGIAANDAVISQGALARLMEIEARLDGTLVNTYRADGLIISTPTGSTAYNLAAGGPLLTPGLEAICLTPICPHTLTNRSLVLPATSVVTLTVADANESAYLTIDGQRGFMLGPDDQIVVSRAPKPLRLFSAPDRDFFELIRTKLRWGERAL